MFDVIHIFSKEYGWSKRQILEEIYYDEIDFYLKRIRKDTANDRLTDLAIAHNPKAKDPKKLISYFQKTIRDVDGKGYLMKERMTKQDERELKELARRMRANAQKRRRA